MAGKSAILKLHTSLDAAEQFSNQMPQRNRILIFRQTERPYSAFKTLCDLPPVELTHRVVSNVFISHMRPPMKKRFSDATFYTWCKKFVCMEVPGIKRLKLSEEENARLRKLSVEAIQDKEALQVAQGRNYSR